MHHLILGAGPVGLATSRALAARGATVTLVSRRAPVADPGVRHLALDARDVDALARAVPAGDTVVHQCLGAPYHRWETDWPPLQAAVVALAKQLRARLVSFENLYPYGAPPPGATLDEATPFAPCSRKGRVRATLAKELERLRTAGELEVAQVRASDLFGPGMLGSALGDELLGRACRGQAPRLLGDPNAPHTFTFVPDAAETMARVATRADWSTSTWHVPSAPALSQHEVVSQLSRLLGRPLKGAPTPTWLLRLVGLFAPPAREVIEMLYEFTAPFVMGDARTRALLQQAHTPFDEALARTVEAFSAR